MKILIHIIDVIFLLSFLPGGMGGGLGQFNAINSLNALSPFNAQDSWSYSSASSYDPAHLNLLGHAYSSYPPPSHNPPAYSYPPMCLQVRVPLFYLLSSSM